LPPTERAGLWFARRSSQIEQSADGQRWLVIDYQLINAPQALKTVNLPSVVLKSKAGNDTLVVPDWPISIAPLTPRSAFAKGGLQELRPDHPAPTLPTMQLRWQMEIWSAAFGLALAAWLGWWIVRSLRAAANQPFAHALREIRLAGDNSADAWLALHRAFDRTAGRALQLSTLPALFKQAPHFETQRAAIERFYDESNLRFFGVTSTASAAAGTGRPTEASGAPVDMPPTAVSLRDLAVTLRRIERQHEP
jgi:mxaA protein